MFFNLFFSNRYYIRLYKNKIEIIDFINGKNISEKSTIGYNNQRLLIAEFVKAESFMIDVFKKHKLSTRNSIVIVQQMEMS